MKKLLYLSSLAALLAACGMPHDAAYYRANTAQRDQKMDMCRGQANAFDNDRECIAAWQALDVMPVSYWLAHAVERKAMTDQCKEHAATLGKAPNCQNASQAEVAVLGGGRAVYVPVGE